ncbi:MAG: sugar transporter [Barnesiella sp.]|nr:sugar transporter [Barnesiella sp.]
MSRTSQGLKNSKVALLFYVLEMGLGFVSRTVFINYIGADVLGLNTTANTLLQFLNLAELGIGSAVAFSLYKPLANDDRQAITEIISIQGWLYRRIALIVALGALVLMAFFPIFFKKTELPLWYAYASFGVLLYTALLTYFFNYKQVILNASQQQYKITYSYKSVMLLRSAAQILAMMFLPHGYVWWLILQVVFGTLATINLQRMVRRTFPYLNNISTNVSKELRRKYYIIITKIKQLFFHKVAAYVLLQTSPLIIYAYANFTLVAIYGNYMLIVTGITMLTQSVFNGVAAGIGDLIARGDKKNTLKVFKEIYTSRFLIVATFCYCVYMLADPFVNLWIGPGYLLDRNTLIVIIAIMYMQLMRTVVDNFIQGFGMFADIWAPIIEAALNISLSILLGYYFGITGILSGVLISLILIVGIWKPIYLFRWGMKEPLFIYLLLYVKHIAVFAVAAFATTLTLNAILPDADNFAKFSLNAVVTFCLFAFFEGTLQWAVMPEMRAFVQRIINLLPIKKLLR